ncbi:MAG: hypothetical protein FWE47_00540 [Oscillospiraceae bacterium]|nr:hypothetical protein [Oscillospiraceae bacterium]
MTFDRGSDYVRKFEQYHKKEIEDRKLKEILQNQKKERSEPIIVELYAVNSVIKLISEGEKFNLSASAGVVYETEEGIGKYRINRCRATLNKMGIELEHDDDSYTFTVSTTPEIMGKLILNKHHFIWKAMQLEKALKET